MPNSFVNQETRKFCTASCRGLSGCYVMFGIETFFHHLNGILEPAEGLRASFVGKKLSLAQEAGKIRK